MAAANHDCVRRRLGTRIVGSQIDLLETLNAGLATVLAVDGVRLAERRNVRLVGHLACSNIVCVVGCIAAAERAVADRIAEGLVFADGGKRRNS